MYAALLLTVESESAVESLAPVESTENLMNLDETLIERDIEMTEDGLLFNRDLGKVEASGFKLHHPTYLIKCGIEAIIEDSVTKRFSAAELRIWNFLARNENYIYLKEHRPRRNSICVANHTTPFDWCVLASDVTYAVVGQKQPGFFGLAESVISSAVPAVWFNRDEVIDRTLTANRLKMHVDSPGSVPLLIFPEGTCINNTSVMKFKKGCFEIGAPIHPVAIKYNSMFADCFWNSSRHTLLQYSFNMLTSWAMVVDVWYLPPTRIREGEDGIQFAKRVQQSIAKCGGLVDINWDGELKRRRPKDTLRVAQQKNISRYVAQLAEPHDPIKPSE